MSGGFSEFGAWETFSSFVNRAGFAWKNLLGQDKAEPWTPGISFDNATTGITYVASTSGNLVKVGRVVVANYQIVLSSKGSATGTARITGLPIAVGSANASDTGMAVGYWGVLSIGVVYLSARVVIGTTTAIIYGATAAATSLSALDETYFSDDTVLHGSLIYYAER